MSALTELETRLHGFLADRASGAGDEHPAKSVDAARQFQRALFDAGLAGLSWTLEDGGQELGAEAEQLYASVSQNYAVPTAPLTLSLKVCGPAVAQFGTREQKARHLTATLRGEQIWCQLWSEPEAGSDLAGVRTRATRVDDGGWVLEGQKIWTSGAHYADYALVLCRSDSEAPKHQGLSMLILDMGVPGVTVRPLRQMTGDSDFNEVFLDNVRVPADALLGDTGQGWPITTWMMGRERVSVGTGMRDSRTLSWSELAALTVRETRDTHPAVRHRLAELHVQERAAHLLSSRLNQEMQRGKGTVLLGSAVKIVEAAVLRANAEFGFQIAGSAATAWHREDAAGSQPADAVLMSPGFAIGGGTDDIQLNTLGEHLLGLPREPRA